MKKFDIEKPDEVAKWFKRGTDQAAERAALGTAMRIVNHIVTEVIPTTSPKPVDRGLYRAGWRAKKVKGGGEVSNATPQAPIIERGARAENVKAGRKMVDALTEWVRRKGIATDEKEARGIAFAIAMKLRRTGIFNGGKGLRVLERALKRVEEFFNDELKSELKKAMKR